MTASPQGEPGTEYSERSFWTIVDQLSGCSSSSSSSSSSSHQQRVEAACGLGLCFWDVLANVHLKGAVKGAPEPNDLPAFLLQHPSVRRLAFNGQQAATEARRLFPQLFAASSGYEAVVLPSSSRGNSRMSSAVKVAEWRKVVSAP